VADLRNVDIVIEAITEDLALKNVLFQELDGLCGAGRFSPPTRRA